MLLTLLVVSLLLVIVLSFVVMVRLELRQMTARQTLLETRSYAKISAMIALAELQKNLGPDTRVSARAEILSTENPDGHGGGIAPFGIHESTRFWTGAWDSRQADLGNDAYEPYKNTRGGRFESWLVSLPSNQRSDIESSRLAVPSSDDLTVPLAKIRTEPLGGGPAVLTEVRAPLADLIDNAKMAWWVSDEGVKANLSLTDPYRSQAQPGADDVPRYLFPHRENFAATKWFENTDFDENTLAERLEKLGAGSNTPWLAFRDASLSTEAMTALAGSAGSGGGVSLFTDYTVHSLGVISNNKKGGLRKDLSLAFWRDPDEILNPTGGTPNAGFNADFSDRNQFHGRIFNKEDYPDTTVRTTTSKQFFGPQWDTLRDFHNSYQKLDNPDSTTPTAFLDPLRSIGNYNPRGLFGGPGTDEKDGLGVGGAETSKGEVLTARTQNGWENRAGMISSPLVPVFLGAQVYFLADVVSDAGQYRPVLKLTTVVSLWNPYNVSISPTQMNGASPAQWSLQGYLGDFKFVFEKNGSKTAEVLLSDFFTGTSNQGLIPFTILNQGSNLNFLPGEIRQYRLSSGNSLTPGFSQDAMIFPIGASDLFLATDTLQVRMEPVQDRITAGGGTFSGVRFDLSASGTLQMNRFDFFYEEVPNTVYEDFELVSNLVGAGDDLFIGGVEFVVKSADEPGADVAGILANFNPRASYPGGALIEQYPGYQPPNYIARLVDTPSNINTDGSDINRMRGFWGNSRDAAGGLTFVPLFDVPRHPPESLGQYQHANLSIFASQPAYAFGNSMAHPHVDRSFAHDNPTGISQIDLSWFLNDTVWDDYFLSTIDPNDASNPSLPQRERFQVLDPNRSFQVSNAEDYKQVASNVMLRGAFNVNSTSVEAWTAFLSSLGGATPSGSLDFPFHRLSSTTASPNTEWTGGPRDLTRSEIRNLATEMVEQVKKRGPFLSLSDFVNRRLTIDNRGRMGALQAAIENAGLNTLVTDPASVLSNAPYPNNVFGSAAALAPGDISQADVLTTLGPKMSVRSDTFLIRSYARNPDTDTEAWCELLVQRIPELNDPADQSDSNPNQPQGAFGRSFEIRSFRYLNQDEI